MKLRYIWPIARVVFCPLTILSICLAVSDLSDDNQEQSQNMQRRSKVVRLEKLLNRPGAKH